MFKKLKAYTAEDILIFLVLITLPLPEHWNSKALLLLLLLVLLRFYNKAEIKFPPFGWLYIALFILSSLSFFWSVDLSETSKAIVRLFPFLLFTLAYKQIFSLKRPDKIIRNTAIVYLTYGLIWIVLAYFRYLENHNSATFFYHELTAPFKANAIYIALIFAQVYVLLLYQLLFLKKKNIDYLLGFSLFIFQFLFSSKMILSLTVIVSFFLFLKYWSENKAQKRLLIIGLSLSLIGISLFAFSTFTKNRFKTILNNNQIEQVFTNTYFGPGYNWNGLTLRLFQLRCFYEIENDPDFNSFLGTGLHASQPVLNQKYKHYDLYGNDKENEEKTGYYFYNFHNQYAQMIVEIGFFGLVLLLLIIYFFAYYPLKNKNSLLIAITLIFIMFAFTESYLLRQKGIVSFVLFPLLALHIFEPMATDKESKDLSLH